MSTFGKSANARSTSMRLCSSRSSRISKSSYSVWLNCSIFALTIAFRNSAIEAARCLSSAKCSKHCCFGSSARKTSSPWPISAASTPASQARWIAARNLMALRSSTALWSAKPANCFDSALLCVIDSMRVCMHVVCLRARPALPGRTGAVRPTMLRFCWLIGGKDELLVPALLGRKRPCGSACFELDRCRASRAEAGRIAELLLPFGHFCCLRC